MPFLVRKHYINHAWKLSFSISGTDVPYHWICYLNFLWILFTNSFLESLCSSVLLSHFVASLNGCEFKCVLQCRDSAYLVAADSLLSNMIFEECSILAVSGGRPWDIFEGIRSLNLTFSSVFLVAGGSCFDGWWKNGRWRQKMSACEVTFVVF